MVRQRVGAPKLALLDSPVNVTGVVFLQPANFIAKARGSAWFLGNLRLCIADRK
jgi:hypothetical protein